MKQEDTTNITARCFHGDPASCSHPCPFFFDVRTFLARARDGKWGLAYKLYRNAVVFPAIVSELCEAPCRTECQRGHIESDNPIDIRSIEAAAVRFAKDRAPETYRIPPRDQSIAIVGAGLSGLSLALNMAQKAYPVTVFERGGQALYTWASHPKFAEFLEEVERQFSQVNVDFVYGREIEGENDPALEGFDYVHFATGDEEAGYESAEAPRAVDAIAAGIEKSKALETWLQIGEWPKDSDTPPKPEKHYVAHKGEPSKAIVVAADPEAGYTKEEASAEASRCMGCDCRICMDACEMLGRYTKRPQKIALEAYTDTKSAPPFSACSLTRQTYSCNLCGHCKAVCPVGIDLEKVFYMARTGRAETGKHPKGFHDFWLRDLEWHSTEGSYFAPGLPDGVSRSDRRYIFFPGCKLGARSPAQTEKTTSILMEAYGAGVLLDCCGVPAYWAGEDAIFRKQLHYIRERWEAAGKPVFILACAYCMRLFGEFLPEVEIVSLYEALAETDAATRKGSPATPAVANDPATPYAVFDPCTARDFPEMEQAVRKLATNAGIKLTELPERNRCCGFGGHMRTANPKLYDVIVENRRSADEAPYLVYCVNCAGSFALEGKEHAHILDLVLSESADGSQNPQTPAGESLQARRDNALRTKAMLMELYEGKAYDPAQNLWDAMRIDIPPALTHEMDGRLILADDLKEAIYKAEQSGEFFILPDGTPNGGELRQCCLIRDVVTTWAQYTAPTATPTAAAPAHTPQAYAIIDTWSHRMRFSGGDRPATGATSAASDPTCHPQPPGHPPITPPKNEWICAKCDIPLAQKNTVFAYMGMTFSHEVKRCPECGIVFISKELADGKMAEVEQLMEDK